MAQALSITTYWVKQKIAGIEVDEREQLQNGMAIQNVL